MLCVCVDNPVCTYVVQLYEMKLILDEIATQINRMSVSVCNLFSSVNDPCFMFLCVYIFKNTLYIMYLDL